MEIKKGLFLKKSLGVWAASAYFVAGMSYATTVTIIDSGLDTGHEMLKGQIWINNGETPSDEIDNDNNGFIDDVYGWNFAENSGKIIDYKYQESHTEDVRKFFDVQAKALMGKASSSELFWMERILKDQEFIKTLTTFGNYAHGTHVGGISAKVSSDVSLMGVKLIPTENPLQSLRDTIELKLQDGMPIEIIKSWLLMFGLDFLAKQQAVIFEQIGLYTASMGAKVANGSFGTSIFAVSPIIEALLGILAGEGPVDAKEVRKYAKHFVDRIVFHSKAMLDSSPDTLFVFAAGNDGKNNSFFPVAPANLRAENAITVAATYASGKLAPFSNYSKRYVDVAAPGVGIESTVPGGYTLKMSGTSQAAPFVAGVVGAMRAVNQSLEMAQIKKILMGTVDKVKSLESRVRAGGVVNSERAIFAASSAKTIGVEQAIERANREIASSLSVQVFGEGPIVDFVLPLPSY